MMIDGVSTWEPQTEKHLNRDSSCWEDVLLLQQLRSLKLGVFANTKGMEIQNCYYNGRLSNKHFNDLYDFTTATVALAIAISRTKIGHTCSYLPKFPFPLFFLLTLFWEDSMISHHSEIQNSSWTSWSDFAKSVSACFSGKIWQQTTWDEHQLPPSVSV